ncbi:MAG TPA: AMP-binding protein [Acidimicrobiales bacterium]|nr:AMP-binding protein [Acidimicrobiales bacterium]
MTATTIDTAARPAAIAAAGSLPALLLARADLHPDQVAMRRFEECVWREITWASYAERVAHVGLGLVALGVGPGDHVAVHSENRPEWLLADLGIQGIGAVTVGVYPTSPPAEVEYVLGHSESVIAIVEDEEQLDKALEVRERLESLRHIVVIDPRLITQHLDDDHIITFAELEALGSAHDTSEFAGRVAALDSSTVATLVYTSGTTGAPKGAMLSHGNLVAAGRSLTVLADVGPGDEILSYLPLCHIAERLNSLVNALWSGVVVNFGRGSDTFASDLRDIQPTMFLGVPRVWEKMMATVEIAMSDATWLKRSTYSFWMRQGHRIAERRMRGAWTPLDRLLYAVGWAVLYRSLRDKLGLRRTHVAISGAAPIAPKVLEFFWALGVPVREGYGQTENTAVATYTPADDVRIGTVGVPVPGTELRLADDGEILTRSDTTFLGYYRDPEATAATFDADGWLLTGDVGEIDADGYVTITDRKKDIIITAGGKNISPSVIENLLKVSPYVREAIVFGDRRKYLTALVGIELDTVGDWATRRFLPYTTYADLSAKPEVRELIAESVAHANRELAQVEQIKDFRLLPRQFDHEDGQLTATQKVKRRAVSDSFGDLVEEMYQ